MEEAKLKVTLVGYTQNPEKLVAASAKLCYSKLGGEELMDNLTDEKTEEFLDRLSGLGHVSPIEHVSFSFAVEGVSRVLTHQLVRHRLASFSQRSQRYVSEGEFDYIIPPEISKNKEAKKAFIKIMEEDQKTYEELSNTLFEGYVNDYLKEHDLREKKDIDKKLRSSMRKKGYEDARYVLPNACETKIMITMNARSLKHFFNVRCCNRAQWEIREMANQMLEQVKEVAPTIFKCAGPSCVSGPCPEGNMSCGKMDEMRERYLGKK